MKGSWAAAKHSTDTALDSDVGTCLNSEFPTMHCKVYVIGSPFIGERASHVTSQELSSRRSTLGAAERRWEGTEKNN